MHWVLGLEPVSKPSDACREPLTVGVSDKHNRVLKQPLVLFVMNCIVGGIGGRRVPEEFSTVDCASSARIANAHYDGTSGSVVSRKVHPQALWGGCRPQVMEQRIQSDERYVVRYHRGLSLVNRGYGKPRCRRRVRTACSYTGHLALAGFTHLAPVRA